MNPEKRDLLRRSLNELVGVRNKNDNVSMYKNNSNYNPSMNPKEMRTK